MFVYEARSLLGIPAIDRYRCGSCGTKFDLLRPFGEIFLVFTGLFLPATVAILPDRKFEHPGDRWSIFACTLLFTLAAVVLTVRSRKNTKANPPR